MELSNPEEVNSLIWFLLSSLVLLLLLLSTFCLSTTSAYFHMSDGQNFSWNLQFNWPFKCFHPILIKRQFSCFHRVYVQTQTQLPTGHEPEIKMHFCSYIQKTLDMLRLQLLFNISVANSQHLSVSTGPAIFSIGKDLAFSSFHTKHTKSKIGIRRGNFNTCFICIPIFIFKCTQIII